MAEKRKTERKIKRFPVAFLCGTQTYRGRSSDISNSGLFIRTRKPLKPGVSVKMVLEMDNHCKIALKGISARATLTQFASFKNGMGVKLTSAPAAYEELLK